MASQTPEQPTDWCPIRCVIVGSSGVGKTSILYRLFKSKVPPIEDFLNASEDQASNVRYGMPALCDACDYRTLNMELHDQNYAVYLRDTSDQEARLRPLSFPGANLALICFSVTNIHSFHAIESSWLEEINHFHPLGIPKIIIGNKIDLRTHHASEEETDKQKNRSKKHIPLLPLWRNDAPEPVDENRSVSREEGMKLAEAINAVAYVECSAITEEGMSEVFHAIQEVKYCSVPRTLFPAGEEEIEIERIKFLLYSVKSFQSPAKNKERKKPKINNMLIHFQRRHVERRGNTPVNIFIVDEDAPAVWYCKINISIKT
ncbi:hypothetical protein EMPG_10560 [Blastomyces silverae]|uniref:Uncharacterized protein n=1 Tax=Blastomyces silverae TaxID=2060906 RepID=A0A0H1B3M0_9EURO|nr:hypothetical protein EMPG_10560 [Blastomyces silverae]